MLINIELVIYSKERTVDVGKKMDRRVQLSSEKTHPKVNSFNSFILRMSKYTKAPRSFTKVR